MEEQFVLSFQSLSMSVLLCRITSTSQLGYSQQRFLNLSWFGKLTVFFAVDLCITITTGSVRLPEKWLWEIKNVWFIFGKARPKAQDQVPSKIIHLKELLEKELASRLSLIILCRAALCHKE